MLRKHLFWARSDVRTVRNTPYPDVHLRNFVLFNVSLDSEIAGLYLAAENVAE